VPTAGDDKNVFRCGVRKGSAVTNLSQFAPETLLGNGDLVPSRGRAGEQRLPGELVVTR
jgi:hypothetical protein